MDDLDLPPTKRRKLSGSVEPTTILPESFSTYIPIARTRIPVRASLDHDKTQSSGPITIKAIKKAHAGHTLQVTGIAWKRTPGRSLATLDTLNHYDERLLEHAIQVESVWRSKSKPAIQPLCCASVYLLDSPCDDVQELEVQLLWQDAVDARDKIGPALFDILKTWMKPNADIGQPLYEKWDPLQFYDNVHVPQSDESNSQPLKIDLLHCDLYPFQRRAVHWLLAREGVKVFEDGQVKPLNVGISSTLPSGFLEVKSHSRQAYFVNHALGVVARDRQAVIKHYATIRGGILAEEMGLGKTVELIALMCLNRRDDKSERVTAGRVKLCDSAATLIITPPTILEQWKSELTEHAPSLRVHHYTGVKARERDTERNVQDLSDFDVVLTTYNVIAREVHYVAEKPDRNLRNKPRFEHPKSPLTEIHWWRVCLDEAQMVESGVSAAATVARLIPRENAWAVTGTPLRQSHRDLYGLLVFLRYEPWCKSAKLWDNLVTYHRRAFRDLMSAIAIRHSKAIVRDELRLPPQSRHTITMPFSAIEEQHYAQLFHEMCQECGLDRNGAPIDEQSDLDSPAITEKMRTWLTRLRQTCLHPEVGGRNRRALGRTGGPLRTVQQVLDVMIDQNEGMLRIEQRNLLLSRIRRGQMYENAKDTREAVAIWKAAYQEASTIAEETRTQVNLEIQNRKASEEVHEEDITVDPGDDAEEEKDARALALRQRLRSALEVKHICIFFIANGYYQLKSDESSVVSESKEFVALEELETSAYDEAKSIRAELLSEVLRKANRYIDSVRNKASESGFAKIPIMDISSLEYTGIESRRIFDKLEQYCDAMNVQTEQFNSLRQKMIDFLRQGLIDEDEGVELQGDEYEKSTKHQDEMYAYMEALRALFADRSDAISGQENLLIRQEMKQFARSAKEGDGPAPELMLQLLAEREAKRVDVAKQGSLRGILAEIRQLVTNLQWQSDGGSTRARSEVKIATEVLVYAQQKLLTVQTKILTSLEQEVNLFRDTMNSRLDYYRALQKISDSVAPYQEEKLGLPLDQTEYARLESEEAKLTTRLSTLHSKHRYLLHLKTESSSSTPRICTICQCEFEVGTLTVCGHQFCKECIQLWYNEHRSCPICKRRLHGTDFYDISYKPAELNVQQELPPSESGSPGSDKPSISTSIYSDISTATLSQIKNVDIKGASFGSKVDTICRHLIWLREHDPGSKAIIFSQFREFLEVLGRAFGQSGISFSRFDDKNGIEKFKSDPAVECFLLHAKAHATGLNLVVASHVFLCEPLVNTAIELQAIARVHRIGQQRATTIWMYLIAETVEESIYDISVTRRLAHLKRKSGSRSGTATPHEGLQEKALDAANSLELQAADLSRLLMVGKSAGELVDKDDLWQCLFGKVKQQHSGILVDEMPANSEVGRFLRAEAVEGRSTGH